MQRNAGPDDSNFQAVISEMSVEQFRRMVREIDPDIVGFSSTSHQLKFLEKYSNAIRDLDMLQIAGGTAATLDPEWILEHTEVEGVCVGEGEIPLAALLSALQGGSDVREVKGFLWRNAKIEDGR